MESRSHETVYGAKIAEVKDDLVRLSDAGTLTRVLDDVALRPDDADFFKDKLKGLFGEQMTGKKSIQVTTKNISDLQAIIRDGADRALLCDDRVKRALDAIDDPKKRADCKRDIVVAFVNKATAKANMDAREHLVRGSEQDNNAKAYMDFVRRVNNLHDRSPAEALSTIRSEATGELAKAVEATRVLRGSSTAIIAESTGKIDKSPSPPNSPAVSRRQELHPSQRSMLKSSPRSPLTSSTAAAAAAPEKPASTSPKSPDENASSASRMRGGS